MFISRNPLSRNCVSLRFENQILARLDLCREINLLNGEICFWLRNGTQRSARKLNVLALQIIGVRHVGPLKTSR